VFSTVQHTQRDPQSRVEEQGDGGDRGNLVEKKESPKWETAVKPVVLLLSKLEY